MGSTTITCSNNNCKRRVQLTTTSSGSTQYRCLGCGCVTPIQDLQQQLHQQSLRRRASNWLYSKGSSSSSSSSPLSLSPNTASPATSTLKKTTPLSSSSSTSSSSSSCLMKSSGRKRALLCGVTYRQSKYKLKGTQNDVVNMQDLLIRTFGFPPGCIRVLSEDDHEQSEELIPTKKNIERSLKWLVEDSQAGDSLVFYFSGHGLRQPDFKDDERDGFDETICPLDFMEEGMILDNDLNSTIVQPLKKGVTLHAIVDACHSGTILDLLHVYNFQKNKWIDNSPPSGVEKSTRGGLAICLSACEDDKMAADTTAFSRNIMNGAMTYIFIEIIKRHSNRGITYWELLDAMHEEIAKINRDGCLNSRFLRKVFRHKIIQEPLLSSSKDFDVSKKKFIL